MRQSAFAPAGERVRVAPCCTADLRRVRLAPPQRLRQSGPLAFGVCHSQLPLSALPVTGSGGAFLPRQGLGVFRHARVSGKRSQTLNSLGGNT